MAEPRHVTVNGSANFGLGPGSRVRGENSGAANYNVGGTAMVGGGMIGGGGGGGGGGIRG